jgi:hypothetical protein
MIIQNKEDELIELLENFKISKTIILQKYKNLSADFCKKYILNEDYSLTDKDSYLDLNDIMYYQPHLNLEDFSK